MSDKIRILVTGAKGLIGSNFARYFQKLDGYEIEAIDRETSEGQIEEYLRDCDYIFNFAGVVQGDYNTLYESNVEYAKRLIEKAVQVGNSHFNFIYISSRKVDTEPDCDYAKTKAEGEELVKKLAKKHKFPYFIYRLNNIFGERRVDVPLSVIEEFCLNAVQGLPCKVLSDSKREFDFTYVGDLIVEFEKFVDDDDKKIGLQKQMPAHRKSLGELKETIEHVAQRMRLGETRFDDKFEDRISRVCKYYNKEKEKIKSCGRNEKGDL